MYNISQAQLSERGIICDDGWLGCMEMWMSAAEHRPPATQLNEFRGICYSLIFSSKTQNVHKHNIMAVHSRIFRD